MTWAPVKALKPLETAQQLKDATVRDYTRNAGRPGMPADSAAIERLAVADLTLAERVMSEDPPAPRKPEPASRKADRHDQVQAEASKVGARIVRDENAARPHTQQITPILDLPAHMISPRWPFALGRLRRVLAGAQPQFNADGTTNWPATLATCEDPKRALEYMQLRCYFDFRHVPQTRRHNPFWGMSNRDAALKFQAEVENICDRSAARLGNWWVPK